MFIFYRIVYHFNWNPRLIAFNFYFDLSQPPLAIIYFSKIQHQCSLIVIMYFDTILYKHVLWVQFVFLYLQLSSDP